MPTIMRNIIGMSPEGFFTVAFCDHVSFRAGYAQGFRSPSLKELYQAYDMGGMGWFMLYGNPDLKPKPAIKSLSGEFTKEG